MWTEGIWALKVFSYVLHFFFSFITVMVSQIMYYMYVFVYYDIPEDAREIITAFMQGIISE